MTHILTSAAAVTERLLERYGPEELRQVEQLSPHILRAQLAGGGIVLAVVREDGTVVLRELEEDWA